MVLTDNSSKNDTLKMVVVMPKPKSSEFYTKPESIEVLFANPGRKMITNIIQEISDSKYVPCHKGTILSYQCIEALLDTRGSMVEVSSRADNLCN